MNHECIVDIETTGLGFFKSEIIAIAIKSDDNIKVLTSNGSDEKKILTDFWKYIKNEKIQTIHGFNIEFDWLFLKMRSIKHRLKVRQLNRSDLRTMFNPDKYAKGKLSEYAEFLGIENTDDISGKDIPLLYENKEWDKIINHIESDVKITYEMLKLYRDSYD